jgi:hypothetical protein
LFDKAREMTGERRDARFKSWAKLLTGVDLEQKSGYAFEGESINSGTVELAEKPHVFLVMFHGARKDSVAEYAVIIMDTEGNLHPTKIMTDDSSGRWVLRIRDDVSALMLSLSVTRPNPLNIFSIEELQAEIDRRTVKPWNEAKR